MMQSVRIHRSVSSLARQPSVGRSHVRARKAISVRTMALFGSKAAPDSLYDIKIKTIDGKDASMSQFKDKVW